MSTSARRRLLRDFKRLQNDPPSGVTGAPMDTNSKALLIASICLEERPQSIERAQAQLRQVRVLEQLLQPAHAVQELQDVFIDGTLKEEVLVLLPPVPNGLDRCWGHVEHYDVFALRGCNVGHIIDCEP